MDTETKTTISHTVIRKWTADNDGTPIVYQQGAPTPEKIAIGFSASPGGPESKSITWEDWFRIFDDKKLAFMYKDHSPDASQPPYYKLVKRQEEVDRHLQSPGEANLDKHINFPELEE